MKLRLPNQFQQASRKWAMEIQVTLGQFLAVVMSSLAGIVGWLIKQQIMELNEKIEKANERVEKVEDALFKLSGEVQKLIGAFHIK